MVRGDLLGLGHLGAVLLAEHVVVGGLDFLGGGTAQGVDQFGEELRDGHLGLGGQLVAQGLDQSAQVLGTTDIKVSTGVEDQGALFEFTCCISSNEHLLCELIWS